MSETQDTVDQPKRGRKPAAPKDEAKDTLTVKAIFGDAVHLLANIALPHNIPTEVPNDSFTQAQIEAGKWTLA